MTRGCTAGIVSWLMSCERAVRAAQMFNGLVLLKSWRNSNETHTVQQPTKWSAAHPAEGADEEDEQLVVPVQECRYCDVAHQLVHQFRLLSKRMGSDGQVLSPTRTEAGGGVPGSS